MIVEAQRMQNGVAILGLEGELDTASLDLFKSQVKELVSEGFSKIIVDCRELGVISSSGLAALLWARSTATSASGAVYLTHVSALVSRVLHITKLSTLLKIEPTTRGLLERLGSIRKTPSQRRKSLASSVNFRA